MTFPFIAAEKATYPVRALCRALAVSASGYYAWCRRAPSARACADVRLRHAIRVAFAETRGRYGSPRVLRELRAHGYAVGRNRIIRLMRADGLVARRRRRFRVTTQSQHAWTVAPDRLQRQFFAPAPNRIWAADVTYLDTAEGWLYLAVVLDLYSRRVVGWAIRPTLHGELTCAALQLAVGRRQPPPALVHHSDRGLQYASGAYQRLLRQHGMRASMSRAGDCWDNAVMESFFSSLKQELAPARWPTRAAATHAIADYIDGFYNPRRRHSTLNYQAPNQFEAATVM